MSIPVFRLFCVLVVLPLTACGGVRETEVAPGPATGEASTVVAADADFMRTMIGHHTQAIDMAQLVAGRSRSQDIALLARRIEESQVFEIGLMRKWLEARGEKAEPDVETMVEMAGMATPEQMRQLSTSRDTAFDRLFLELMIRHHEGALVMVETLTAQGGGLDLDVFQLISHIDADQRAEIARMQRMHNALQ